ncbi:MAG: DUF2911 domain-containing protein [Bryobacteraceae bacterium]
MTLPRTLALSALAILPVLPQQTKQVHPGKGGSPHVETTWTVQGKKITVNYGRPFAKGRKVFGGLEPYGQVWRAGADEATVFTTEADLMLGSLHVPAGTYSLFAIPSEKEWTLVLNKTAKQWGTFSYDQKQDLGRAPMKVAKAPSTVEQFTINIEGGHLKLSWGDTIASIPLMVH